MEADEEESIVEELEEELEDDGSEEEGEEDSAEEKKRRKPKIPWDKPNADEKLFKPLFEVAYVERMHLLEYRKVIKSWDAFTKHLFKNVDPFPSMSTSITHHALRRQFNARINKHKESPSGVCDDLDSILDNIVREMSEMKVKKKETKEETKLKRKRLESIEEAVLHSSATTQSKKKRAALASQREPLHDPSSSSSSSRSSSPEDVMTFLSKNAEILTEVVRKTDIVPGAMPGSDKEVKLSFEEKLETELFNVLSETSTEDILKSAKIPDPSADLLHAWDECGGLAIVLSVYCALGKNFDREYVLREWESMGFPHSITPRLYWYLSTLKKTQMQSTT